MSKTLLVDGNNLLNIGIYGVKELFHEGRHMGGIFHFMNTIRRFIDEQHIDKVLVFWDGDDNSLMRKRIYPNYKDNRRERDNEYKIESFYRQKERLKMYLEECFVRQVEVNGNEADDLIAYYCQISENEKKLIFSGDGDLTQLISENTTVYSPKTKKYYNLGDKITIDDCEIPHFNVKTYKILIGDKSDNISGIYYFGEKTLIKFFPEILENDTSFQDILKKAEQLLKENKDNNALKNLLTGKTKDGIFGEEFFQVNEKIIDLSNPLITEDAKHIVNLYYAETLDPEGRNYKNLMKLMMEDGFFKFLPKKDDAWVEFLRPFLKLTRKEKNKNKKQ